MAKLAERLDKIQTELNEVLCESADLELGLGLLHKSVDETDNRSTQLDERMFDLQQEVLCWKSRNVSPTSRTWCYI